MTRIAVIIAAAGSGSRFGGPKQFAVLRGIPVLERAVGAFQAHPAVDDIILVLPAARIDDRYPSRFGKIVAVVPGGERRQDSVRRGLEALDGAGVGLVLVHDGARPIVAPELVERVIEAVRATGAAVPGAPLEDTVKEVREGRIAATVDRASLVRAQTPQGFRYALLREALEAADRDGFTGTDESSLVERLGVPVARVSGDPRNIKITTPLDIKIAEALVDG